MNNTRGRFVNRNGVHTSALRLKTSEMKDEKGFERGLKRLSDRGWTAVDRHGVTRNMQTMKRRLVRNGNELRLGSDLS